MITALRCHYTVVRLMSSDHHYQRSDDHYLVFTVWWSVVPVPRVLCQDGFGSTFASGWSVPALRGRVISCRLWVGGWDGLISRWGFVGMNWEAQWGRRILDSGLSASINPTRIISGCLDLPSFLFRFGFFFKLSFLHFYLLFQLPGRSACCFSSPPLFCSPYPVLHFCDRIGPLSRVFYVTQRSVCLPGSI